MKKLLSLASFFTLALFGCAGPGYLPYAPHSMDPAALDHIAQDASQVNGVPFALTRAIIAAESGGDPSALSSVGAQGLMQLMPGTASAYGVGSPFDPRSNVEGGTRYLRDLLARYHNNVELAVAAYNAGPGAVDAYHGVPPFAETRAYVARVIAAYRNF